MILELNATADILGHKISNLWRGIKKYFFLNETAINGKFGNKEVGYARKNFS